MTGTMGSFLIAVAKKSYCLVFIYIFIISTFYFCVDLTSIRS